VPIAWVDVRVDTHEQQAPTIHAAHDGEDAPQERDHGPTSNDPRSTTHASSHVPRSTTDEKRSSAHAHAHALADAHDESPMDPALNPGPFPHEKLDLYRVALEMVALAKDLAEEIPRDTEALPTTSCARHRTRCCSTPREQTAAAQR
jgi:hypothetical protein